MLTLGVDAARGGWIAVALRGGAFVDAVLERRFPALLERFPDATVVGVDVPIGFADVGTRRRADEAARAAVGARRSSVFFTPPRAALEAPTYGEARALAPGTSAQGWALRTAILDVDRVRDPRVHEVHPEVSFAVLARAPLPFAKRTWNGQHERRRLLASAGIELPERPRCAGRRPRCCRRRLVGAAHRPRHTRDLPAGSAPGRTADPRVKPTAGV